jgi:hypothetical protein
VFWADSEAKVQIAPSGMIEEAEGRLCHFSHSSPALVIVVVTSEFFRAMSSIVSFVSSGDGLTSKSRP